MMMNCVTILTAYSLHLKDSGLYVTFFYGIWSAAYATRSPHASLWTHLALRAFLLIFMQLQAIIHKNRKHCNVI